MKRTHTVVQANDEEERHRAEAWQRRGKEESMKEESERRIRRAYDKYQVQLTSYTDIPTSPTSRHALLRLL